MELRIEIHSLHDKPELNDTFCVLCGWNAEVGRYQVRLLDGNDGTRHIRVSLSSGSFRTYFCE